MAFQIFKEINDLHQATRYHEKTNNPLFHVFNTKFLKEDFRRSMPPYQQDFYQVGLNLDLTGTSFTLQSTSIQSLNNLLFFVAPGQVITWEVSGNTDGFLLYFKKDFFSFYRGSIENAFSFFKISHANFICLTEVVGRDLNEDLRKIRSVYEAHDAYQQEQLQGLTYAFLFKCKGLFEGYEKEVVPGTRKQQLYDQYIQLIDRFFLQYRSVEEFAGLLNVTPNYLSSVIKDVARRSGKSILDERVLAESKNMLTYTELSISEIANALNFSEPTHFIRFFKRQAGITPVEFRQNRVHAGH